MKKFIGIAALLFSCTWHSALADDASDSRIKLLPYNEADVYTITTRYGYQTNIVFGPTEEIQTISVGDRSLWQIIPAGHRLFIRPMEDGATTNMTVITERRSYQFDLKAVADDKSNGNIYVAQFVYPSDKPHLPAPSPAVPPAMGGAAAMPPAMMENPPLPPAAAMEPSVLPPVNAPVTPPLHPNYNYTFAGPDDLAPLKVYDDGHSTLFKYRDTTQPFPNVYTIDATGKETLVTPYRQDGFMVVDTVTGEFALKSSAGTIHVFNEMLNPPK